MSEPQRTPEGKLYLYDVSAGRMRAFWPVDAAAHLRSGACTADPPDAAVCAAAEAPSDPAPAVPVPPKRGPGRPRKSPA